jgi:hypothetical protein
MDAQISEVNRWKSFLRKKFAGKTGCMQRTFSLTLVLCSLVLILPLVSQAATKTVGKTAAKTMHPARVAPEPEPDLQPEPVAVTNDGFWKGFGVGALAGYVDYKEPGLMREYGKLYGVNFSYTAINQTSRLAYNFEGEIVFGRLLYDGGSQNIATGVITPFTAGTSDYIFNTRGTIGLYRELNSSLSLTPYLGLGYRDLNDKTDGSGSYNRNISYIYVPLGGQIAARFGDTNSFSFAADFDLAVGTVVSKLSDLNSSNPDITNHNAGFGYRLVASFKHNFGRWSGHLQPFYQKWKMNKSDDVSIGFTKADGSTGTLVLSEPVNESDFIGFNIGADL